MGNTQYAQIPYPEPSAFVAQGANAMRSLAEAIDPRWSGAALVRRVNMNVANNTATPFAWSAGVNTPNVGGSVPSSVDGITLGQAGVYLCHLVAHWDANASGTRSAQILSNGGLTADDAADARAAAGASIRTVHDLTRIFRFAAGVVVNATVTQTSGAALAIIFARLEVYRIA